MSFNFRIPLSIYFVLIENNESISITLVKRRNPHLNTTIQSEKAAHNEVHNVCLIHPA